MNEIKMIVQKNKVTETADGGFKITFECDRSQMVNVAKVLCIEQTQSVELTINYAQKT